MPPDPSNSLRKQGIFLSHHGGKTRNISMIIQFYPNIKCRYIDPRCGNPDPAAHAYEDPARHVPTFAYPEMIEGCRFKMENLVDRLPSGTSGFEVNINVTYILDNKRTILQSGFLPSLEKEEIKQTIMFRPFKELEGHLEEFHFLKIEAVLLGTNEAWVRACIT